MTVNLLFNMVGKGSHPSIIRNIISYLDRTNLPVYYQQPELMAAEFTRILNTMVVDCHLLSSTPKNVSEQQLYFTLEVEPQEQSHHSHGITGKFRVFVGKTVQPMLEELFKANFNQNNSLQSCKRDLYLYGEHIGCKIFPEQPRNDNWLTRFISAPKSLTYSISYNRE